LPVGLYANLGQVYRLWPAGRSPLCSRSNQATQRCGKWGRGTMTKYRSFLTCLVFLAFVTGPLLADRIAPKSAKAGLKDNKSDQADGTSNVSADELKANRDHLRCVASTSSTAKLEVLALTDPSLPDLGPRQSPVVQLTCLLS
jgi:hypothetical protein